MVSLADRPPKEKPALRSFIVNVEGLKFNVRVRADEVNDAVVSAVTRKLAGSTFESLQITRED